MSKSKSSDVVKKVLDYLKEQNRPFSVVDILQHFQNDCNKTAITKALDLLVSEEKVKEKTYGKYKVFYINQNVFEDLKKDVLDDWDRRIIELTEAHSRLKACVTRYGILIENLSSAYTVDKAKEELLKCDGEDEFLNEKLDKLQSKSSRADLKEIETVNEDKVKYQKTLKQRKRMANDMIDAISEGNGKSRKVLMAEIGIQTDTDLIPAN